MKLREFLKQCPSSSASAPSPEELILRDLLWESIGSETGTVAAANQIAGMEYILNLLGEHGMPEDLMEIYGYQNEEVSP